MGIDDVGFQKSFSGKVEFVIIGHVYRARFVLVNGKLEEVKV